MEKPIWSRSSKVNLYNRFKASNLYLKSFDKSDPLYEDIKALHRYLKYSINTKSVIDQVVAVVAESLDIEPEQICEASRKREYVDARRCVYYICIKIEEIGQSEVGRYFDKDHSTINSALRDIEDLTLTDRSFKEALNRCIASYNEFKKSIQYEEK
jgi:chromosomal replication initiator protein